MINEDPNNGFHWKNKLDELEILPGETFNKEMVWNKVHDRLHRKSGKKKTVWYWAAAAILLFLLIIPLLTLHKSEPQVVKTETIVKQSNEIIKPGSTDDENYTVKSINNGTTSKDKTITVENKLNQKNHIDITYDVSGKIRFKDSASIIQFATETNTKSLQPIDTFSNIAITIPPKKKLKVVHINELGDPVEEPPTMARNADNHSFQLKLANQEVFINPSDISRATGFTIFKTKSSPN